MRHKKSMYMIDVHASPIFIKNALEKYIGAPQNKKNGRFYLKSIDIQTDAKLKRQFLVKERYLKTDVFYVTCESLAGELLVSCYLVHRFFIDFIFFFLSNPYKYLESETKLIKPLHLNLHLSNFEPQRSSKLLYEEGS